MSVKEILREIFLVGEKYVYHENNVIIQMKNRDCMMIESVCFRCNF